MNKVMHFDIPVDNIPESAAFYSDVFGWDLPQNDPQKGEGELGFRTALTAESKDGEPVEPGAINGALVKRDLGITQPVILIEVDDIKAKLQEVAQAGGKILRDVSYLPTCPLGSGYFAYITDPEGNVLSLWEFEG